jgi:hypothetical protein
MGICIYLKSLKLFGILQDSGIEMDDRGIPPRDAPQLILPLTRFNSESEVDSLANLALDTLMESQFGSSNIYPLVSEVFAS